MRILAVDPGQTRIGIAISDPTGTIANPLTVLAHHSRAQDAREIIALADQHAVERIIVGQPLDEYGAPTFEGRRAARLGAAIRARTDLPVVMWDESGSTKAAQEAQIALGVSRKRRQGPIDDLAATVILQSYLDAQPPRSSSE